MAKNEHHLLVIRLSALGDVAMAVPLLNALIKKYPELRLTILTKKVFLPLFEDIPNTQVLAAEVKGRHKGIRGLWRLYKELLQLDIDAVADLHNVLRSNVLKRYFKFSKIPFVQIDKGRKEKKALTASKNKAFKPLKTTLERYSEVFEALGFPIDLSVVKPLKKKNLTENMLNRIGQNNLKWIGIAPFAAYPGKTYPLSRMEEVIQQLDQSHEYLIFLFGGGPREKQLLEEVASRNTHAINMVGETDLTGELRLISNLDVMVSMDSANAHLAAMYGIPTVTLWGVTHPYAGFYPFGQDPENAILADRSQYPLIPTSVYGKRVPKGYEHAMETILPEEILKKVYSILG